VDAVRYILRLQLRLAQQGAGIGLIVLQPLLTLGIFAVAIGAGNLVPFAIYWLVPIATWLSMILRIRSIAEHYALPHDHVWMETRTVIPNLLEALFIAPKNIAYHIEHHQYPSVPFYRLWFPVRVG
jgi:fatty acid desaturase